MSLSTRIASGLILPVFLLLSGGLFFIVGCDDDDADDAAEGTHSGDTGAGETEFGLNGEFATMEEWGEHLVTTHGCNDCHSAKTWGPEGPGIDQAMMMAGHPASETLPEHDPSLVGMAPGKWILANNNFTAYVGPWGTSYAANLTPDPTGIGSWTEDQFLLAMKEGWYKGMEGTRKLLPPMPWQAYGQLADEELRAIYSYLMTIPPVENVVPAAKMAGPPPGAAPGGEDAPADSADTNA